MKFFSDCSDCENCKCRYTACLAGHGDNDFSEITEKWIKNLIETTSIPQEWSEYKKNYLKSKFPNLSQIITNISSKRKI